MSELVEVCHVDHETPVPRHTKARTQGAGLGVRARLASCDSRQIVAHRPASVIPPHARENSTSKSLDSPPTASASFPPTLPSRIAIAFDAVTPARIRGMIRRAFPGRFLEGAVDCDQGDRVLSAACSPSAGVGGGASGAIFGAAGCHFLRR